MMGVGSPQDIVMGIELGEDMFDYVLPMNGQMAMLLRRVVS